MRASPPGGRSSAGLAAGSAGRTEAVGAWLGAMLPGRQSRALRQGLDRHAIVGLARALQRRHELARARAGNLKPGFAVEDADRAHLMRSEEHTSEIQSLMRLSSAVFCLKQTH